MAGPERDAIMALSASIWRRDRKRGADVAALRLAEAHDHPLAWALTQSVEFMHPAHALREQARQANARRAGALPAHLWADRVAARWPEDEAHPERFLVVQRRRLELALRSQLVWPLGALEQIVRARERIHGLMRALLWIDERERLCWLDEHAQPRDVVGQAVAAGALRMAHPTHPAMQALDQDRLLALVDTTSAPFVQVKRERFGPDALALDPHGWHRPRWDRPLPLHRLMRQLRRRGGWRLTHGEDNGTVAGFFMSDERAGLTALFRLMDAQDRPIYGYGVYSSLPSPDLALRVGLLLLRGAWDRQRIDFSYQWPPNVRAWGMQPHDFCAPGDADPLFLSEVLRDVWLASAP